MGPAGKYSEDGLHQGEAECVEGVDDAMAADDDRRTGPLRRCLATGEILNKDDLIRFVADPGGQVVPDIAARLPGRGFYVKPERECLQRAVDKRLFARGARRPVIIPESLVDQVIELLRRRCLDHLALANRAGEAFAGFEKIRAAVRADEPVMLYMASDGGKDGRRQIAALIKAAELSMPIFDVFSGVELGSVFGRERSGYVAVTRGGLAKRLKRDTTRLNNLLGGRDKPTGQSGSMGGSAA